MTDEVRKYLYEVIAQDSMFGIVVFKEDGSCMFINAMAKQMLDNEDPSLQDLFPPSEKPPFKSFSSDFLKHDGLYQDILVRKNSMGSFIANVGNKHVAFSGVSANLLMLQDVTLQKKLQREITQKQNEIKSAYEELLKQNTQLKELDVAKNRFIALTTHELRTPLSAMVASAEILKMGLYDTPEQMKEFVDMIHEQGIHLQDLVNDILDFAKIQAGKMDFYIELEDVATLAKTIFHSFESMAEANKVKMVFATPIQPMKCYYDDVRLRQVLSNIINNAIKYNRSGGSVTMTFEENEKHVKVSVQDTGKGMPADQFDKVFNEFETIGQVAQHHKGTGLGMPISRKLTQGMGGNLDFTSELGVGSTFWVEIPKTKVLGEELYQPRPGKLGEVDVA